jgi:hypothetical protein
MERSIQAAACRQPVAVGGLAGLADRHDDAAPIGVLAGDRGLHQRRIGDRHRDAARRSFRHRALDHDLDQLARAFAVARHLFGEIGEHGVEGLAERTSGADRGARLMRGAPWRRGAGGESQQRVGGRGVAVDGDGVEGVDDALAQQRCSAGAAIGASVNTKASIVAMSGAIMPAPLAMPLMVTVGAAEPRASRSRVSGKVSVVMIARAASP